MKGRENEPNSKIEGSFASSRSSLQNWFLSLMMVIKALLGWRNESPEQGNL